MSSSTSQIDVSVVIPCLNESENVEPIARAVQEQLLAAGVQYEIIFIDNSSTDDTVERIKAICAADDRVKLIANNRNYGQLRSPTYAIYQTSGRGVIAMCADFQDPPELIGEFVRRWRAGEQIVLGVRRTERTSVMLKLARAAGYGFLERFGDYRVIPGATGFGIYDRAVVDVLAKWREPEPFFRGMLVESGFPISTIAYDRPRRAAGSTKNGVASLVAFAISGVASSSKQLLRLPLYLAIATGSIAIILALSAAAAAIVGHNVTAWLILAFVEFNVAMILGFLGLMGEQIRLISERTRRVPLVIEQERLNF